MVNNEVELIRTVDIKKKEQLIKNLVNSGISYLEKWEKVPFFKRREYNGSKEVCVIYINDSYLERAEEILKRVESGETDPRANRHRIKALLDGEKKNPKKK